MSRFKLIKTESNTLNDIIKHRIISLIDSNYFKGEYTRRREIADLILSECKISQGGLSNILDELVDHKKISTFYYNKARFYGPPKMLLSIKVAIAVTTVIIGTFIFLDALLPKEMIKNVIYLGFDSNLETPLNIIHLPLLPFVILPIAITILITFIWFLQERKSI